MADDRHKPPNASALQSSSGSDENTPFQTAADLQKINSLSEKVEKALTGTLHGEFYEGTRSSNANRHQQLGSMFQLRQELQELKASMQIRQANEEFDNDANKRGPRPTVNMMATIKDLVAERVQAAMRDSNIQIGRLQEQVEKAGQREHAQQEKIESLEARLKKATPKPGCTQEQFQAVQRRLAQAEQKHDQLQWEIQDLREKAAAQAQRKAEDAVASFKGSSGVSQASHLLLERRVTSGEQKQKQLDDFKSKVDQAMNNVMPRLKSLETRSQSADAAIEEVKKACGKIDKLSKEINSARATGEAVVVLNEKVAETSEKVQSLESSVQLVKKGSAEPVEPATFKKLVEEMIRKVHALESEIPEIKENRLDNSLREIVERKPWEYYKYVPAKINGLETIVYEERTSLQRLEHRVVVTAHSWSESHADMAKRLDKLESHLAKQSAIGKIQAEQAAMGAAMRKGLEELANNVVTQGVLNRFLANSIDNQNSCYDELAARYAKDIEELKAGHAERTTETSEPKASSAKEIDELKTTTKQHASRLSAAEDEIYFSAIALDRYISAAEARAAGKRILEEECGTIDEEDSTHDQDAPAEAKLGLEMVVKFCNAKLQEMAKSCE